MRHGPWPIRREVMKKNTKRVMIVLDLVGEELGCVGMVMCRTGDRLVAH